MICEKCKANLVYFRNGSSCGWSCPKCNWGIATTFREPWEDDNTLYTINIKPTPEVNLASIKSISKVLGLNSLKTKELLKSGGTLQEEYAAGIIEKAQTLFLANICFTISPDFPYKWSREENS